MLSQILVSAGTAVDAAPRIVLDGRTLRVVDVVRLADRTGRPAAPDPAALARAERAWETASR
ncbi:MAG: histidine ammonia-lyase, partial [Streptomyces sp.]|nr:histidine ammonia-lyase [Streptomyces sp.]